MCAVLNKLSPIYSHAGLLAISAGKQVSSDAALLFETVTLIGCISVASAWVLLDFVQPALHFIIPMIAATAMPVITAAVIHHWGELSDCCFSGFSVMLTLVWTSCLVW